MSSEARRAEKRIKWEAEQVASDLERRRREARSVWLKIEEADASDDVKEILHLFADKLGLEQ